MEVPKLLGSLAAHHGIAGLTCLAAVALGAHAHEGEAAAHTRRTSVAAGTAVVGIRLDCSRHIADLGDGAARAAALFGAGGESRHQTAIKLDAAYLARTSARALAARAAVSGAAVVSRTPRVGDGD